MIVLSYNCLHNASAREIFDNQQLYQSITNSLIFSAGLQVCDWLKWTKKFIALADSCIIWQELSRYFWEKSL
jgi:hypothetical protein